MRPVTESAMAKEGLPAALGTKSLAFSFRDMRLGWKPTGDC